jgi:hypothetical protein
MPYQKVFDDVPAALVAGDSVSWKKSFSDYPAPTWVISYALVKADKQLTITGTADGTAHLVEVAATVTAAYPAGLYAFQEYVTKAATSERYKTGEGEINILPDYAQASAKSLETRSFAKQVVDTLEPIILGKVAKDTINYAIAGRSLTSMSISDINQTYLLYLGIYKNEQRREKRKRGKRTGQRVKIRFCR